MASQGARCPEAQSSPTEPSTNTSFQSEWVSMEVDNEAAAPNIQQNPLEELKVALSMANKHVAALEKALFRYEVLRDEDIKNYTGLVRTRFDAVEEMIHRFKPLSCWKL